MKKNDIQRQWQRQEQYQQQRQWQRQEQYQQQQQWQEQYQQQQQWQEQYQQQQQWQEQYQQINNLAQEIGVEILDCRDDDFLRVGQVLLLGPQGGIVVRDELPIILDALKTLENTLIGKEVNV
jgi:alpha-D-ribose 1-methylphosphonate 5-triphosphate diphosphatase PhnM